MEYKERLERATLMAMQGVINNNEIQSWYGSGVQAIVNSSFDIAKATLNHIDSQFPNQETQEEQEPKRGDVVWVRDFDEQDWIPLHFVRKLERGYCVSCGSPDKIELEVVFNQMITKNPYTDGN